MTEPRTGPSALSWPLVGRDDELRLLSAAMDDSACGGVALVGPAGVGKSRLARQVADLAAVRGLSTIAVRATRSSSTIPYGALSPLFVELGIDPLTTAQPLYAVVERIDQRRANGRGVLIVDDAQELDDASAALLDQLVSLGASFVVLTVRQSEGTAEVLLDMWKDERLMRVQVEPLADPDVRSLVQIALGAPVDGAALQAIVTMSGGNALYLRELVQGALEAGVLVSRRGIWCLTGSLVRSPRLRDLIVERLRGLSDLETTALELVALGEPLDLSLLATLVPLAVVEAVERRGVLDSALAEGAPEVRLAHPLYGEVVRAHLPASRRARLCRSLSDAAESAGLNSQHDLLRAAVWRLECGGGSAEVTLAAAKAAFRSEDFVLAARLARSAWEQWGHVDAAILLADALDLTGRRDEVETVLRQVGLVAGSDVERTTISIRLASCLSLSGRLAEADDVLTEAAAATDPESRRIVDAQRCNHALRSGDVARTIELAIPLLVEQGDPAFAAVSRDLSVALALAGRTTEAIAHAETAMSARRGLEDQNEVFAAAAFLVAKALALAEAGRLAEGAALAEAGYSASVERRNFAGQAWFGVILGLTLAVQGRLVTADHFYRETATIFRSRRHPGGHWGLGGTALAAGQMGDGLAAAAAIAELDSLGPSPMRLMDVHVERGRAWAAVAQGDLDRARAILHDALALAEQWGQRSSEAAVLHDLLQVGEGAETATRLGQLAKLVDGDLMKARAILAAAVVLRDPDRADEAAAAFERCGALLFAAEAAALSARLANAAGAGRRASAAAAEAERLSALCENARTPGLTVSAESEQLSAREREVAVLAAEGLTSRQIAERLFVSSRTVDNHLQRAYVKLGVSSRSDLAERLAQAG